MHKPHISGDYYDKDGSGFLELAELERFLRYYHIRCLLFYSLTLIFHCLLFTFYLYLYFDF